MPDRFKQLEHWLDTACGLKDYRLTTASADASFRRYYRIHAGDGQPRIVMDAPPDREDCRPFVDVERRLARAGVHVPEIFAHDFDQGFMLLEDLGDRLYLPHLTADTVAGLYGDAMDALLEMQARGRSDGLPVYDADFLRNEMSLFPEWLLGRHLGLALDGSARSMLDQVFALLERSAREQPQVLVHRDYHSRNLLICDENNPGVIDFQDAVVGPLTYDLVSLLRDCYIRWSPAQVDDWALDYKLRAVGRGLLQPCADDEFLRWFDLMGTQRHLKAAGIFARLNHRDGKPGYMQDIPRILGYIVDVAERRSELVPLAQLIERAVLVAF